MSIDARPFEEHSTSEIMDMYNASSKELTRLQLFVRDPHDTAILRAEVDMLENILKNRVRNGL